MFASLPLLAQRTTDNAASCDIAVAPAATLLLPYFEVDTNAAAGTSANALFTITNTSRYPQIAHVVVWTDWAYPVLTFNLFLTGYDVQGVNLFDIIVRGLIPRTAIGSDASNPNFLTFSGDRNASATCAALPDTIPADLAQMVKNALTVGILGVSYNPADSACKSPVGSNTGTRAKGYITVDVVSTCTTQLPTDARGTYFGGFQSPLLFDNVLLGDYQQLGSTPAASYETKTYDAQAAPMVHIRAIPEGGLSGAAGGQPVATPLPYTFYDRYTPSSFRAMDRRQPLPSRWALRYIQGGRAAFATDLKIWREGVTAGLPTCSSSGTVQRNSVLLLTKMVRFDEHENAYGYGYSPVGCTCAPALAFLSASSRMPTTHHFVPAFLGTDVGGWLYVNLSSQSEYVSNFQTFAPVLSAQRAGFGPNPPGTDGSRTTTQSWLVSSMYGTPGAGRLSVDFDAAWLGNGCTPAVPEGALIAPAAHSEGALVCPDHVKCAVGTRPATVNP